MTPGKAFFEKVNDGKPFLKNYDKKGYPSGDDLQFYPMPPVAGTITVNVGRSLTDTLESLMILTDTVQSSRSGGGGRLRGLLLYWSQQAWQT